VQGPDARELTFEQVCLAGPARVLEVGCGEGELAQRILLELRAEVVAVDQSERMVELTRARGVDARVADVQALPFPSDWFDVAVAAWMLYHVPDLDQGVRELARVLRPGGRLVAATNCDDHLAEMLALAGIEHWQLPFSGETAERVLSPHFATVERLDADGTVVFPDIEPVRSYFASSQRLSAFLDRLPPRLDGPLTVRRRPVVFVATKAAT
jgi:SAM-dependent methyltransferase